MPSAHAAYRPHPEVEVLRSKRISLEEAIRGVSDAVESDTGASATSQRGSAAVTSEISFQQIPRVLESLRGEWSEVPSDSCPRCFTEVQGRLIVHMHPFFLGARLMQGMRSAAGMLLMRYSRVLRQVPLAFKRLKPANTHAAVVGESAWVHFIIEFTSIGFRPTVNDNVVGLLGPVQTAVGVNFQVSKLFNFFVHRAVLPADSWFDEKASAWMEGEKKMFSRQRPQFLRIAKQVDETSGDTFVSMKGVLADARDEVKLEAVRKQQRLDKSVSAAKRKWLEEETAEGAAAVQGSATDSGRQDPQTGGAPPEGAKKLRKVKKEPREEPAAEPAEAGRRPRRREASAAVAAPVEPCAAAEQTEAPRKVKKEPRDDAPQSGKAKRRRSDPAAL